MNQVINWLNPQLQHRDFATVIKQAYKVVHLRSLLKGVVHSILNDFPWDERTDLVDLYNPATRYVPGQQFAIPLKDPQGLRPTAWQIRYVKSVEDGENPVQGSFQVVTFGNGGPAMKLAANVSNASSFLIELPVDESEDIDWLTSYFVDEYFDPLVDALDKTIKSGTLNASIKGGSVIIGDSQDILSEEEKFFLEEIIDKQSTNTAWINSKNILQDMQSMGGLNGYPSEFALFTIDDYLSNAGYKPLGNYYWIMPDKLDEIDREVQRRRHVPIIQSKLAKELGEQEEEEKDYSEFELDNDAKKALESFGEEDDGETSIIEKAGWQPPTSPIQLPTLTYQNMIEAFFPLPSKLEKAFPPHDGQQLIEVLVIDEDEKKGTFPFLVNRNEKLIKALDKESTRKRFIDANIPAGTKLWLEYLHDHVYRIYPKPLASPTTHKCKIAIWGEDGNLTFDVYNIPINYEHESQLFVAEFRHSDPVALFREAKQVGLSIFDALYYSFQSLAKLSPSGRVHYAELFNAVFFTYRMCSPRSVITELYSRHCFIAAGDGYFYLDVNKGIHRKSNYRKQKTSFTPDKSLLGILGGLNGKELLTLDQGKPFKTIEINKSHVVIQTSTGEKRNIDVSRLQSAWDYLLRNRKLSRSEIQDLFSEFNPAYIAAILAKFPDVRVTTNPIVLHYGHAPVANIWERHVLSVDPTRYIGWTVVHQRVLKGYEELWASYFEYLITHNHADEDEVKAATGIHWRGTMHPRYLGLITERREVTPAGVLFIANPSRRSEILHSQLQKWYYCVDLFCDPDPDYDVFPFFALLKILLSLPESSHSISLEEMRFFVLPTKSISECSDRVDLIKEYRTDTKTWRSRLEPLYRKTYIGRVGHLLELSPYFQITDLEIRLNRDGIRDGADLISEYEKLDGNGKIPHYLTNPNAYLDMLRSDKTIFECCD